jgi:hypothetical protein
VVGLIVIVASSSLHSCPPNHSAMQVPATTIRMPKIQNVSSILMDHSVRKRGGKSINRIQNYISLAMLPMIALNIILLYFVTMVFLFSTEIE